MCIEDAESRYVCAVLAGNDDYSNDTTFYKHTYGAHTATLSNDDIEQGFSLMHLQQSMYRAQHNVHAAKGSNSHTSTLPIS